MKQYIALMIAVGSVLLAGARIVEAQTNQITSPSPPATDSGLSTMLSQKQFLGTRPVLRLDGEYVNTPEEDYEMLGMWSSPVAMDQPNGLLAELYFGNAQKRGEWQLAYKRRLTTLDSSWEATADANPDFTASQRAVEVLKASYAVLDWWQVGVAAVFEQKPGIDTGLEPRPFGLGGGESLAIQIDTTMKF